jgi:hypothetical protein
MYKVYNSNEILQDVDLAIKEKRPFSLLRGGDGTLGVFSVCFLNGFIKIGHWSTEANSTNRLVRKRGKPIGADLVKLLLSRVSIPWEKRLQFFGNTIQYLKEADYIDSFQNYAPGSIKALGNQVLAENWDKILKGVGINLENKKFCDPRFNFFCMLKDQTNLFDIIKGRKIFCISNMKFKWLKELSGAASTQFYVITRNIKCPTGNGMYIEMNRINQVAKNSTADLYLVGAGFVGRNICGYLRQEGKVVLDVGSLFDYWSGLRNEIVLPTVKKMIQYNPNTKLFHKIGEYKSIIL